ncbi:hypothetical protein NMY22_g532 [Coprinellus aureogranulatus]|nr:hypothetical protein NMY22_g532 [Coprinellus aureogranulatus]
MAKLHSDNARRTIAWVAFFTAILYWRSWRDFVPQAVVGVMSSLNWSEAVHDPKFSAMLKHDTGNRSLPTHTGDQLDTADLHRPKLLANQRLLTGILPVSSASLSNLEQMLEPLLDPSAAALRDIVLLLPSRLRSRASKLLLRVLTRHEGRDHPEISLRTWDAIADGSLTSPSMLRFLDPGISSWALIMDYGALEELDQDTRRRLLGEVVDWRLPYGPKGTPKIQATSRRSGFIPPSCSPH